MLHFTKDDNANISGVFIDFFFLFDAINFIGESSIG